MKILIDLSILKNVNCGLGQVALNYGYYFRDTYTPIEGETVYLLVPKSFIGAFGDKVRYIQARKILRVFPFLTGIRFDVWHAIHQLVALLAICPPLCADYSRFQFRVRKTRR